MGPCSILQNQGNTAVLPASPLWRPCYHFSKKVVSLKWNNNIACAQHFNQNSGVNLKTYSLEFYNHKTFTIISTKWTFFANSDYWLRVTYCTAHIHSSIYVVQNHKLFKEKEVEGKYSYLNTLLLIFLFSTDINLRNWQVFFAHTMDMMDESQLSTTKLGLQCVNWWNNFLIQFQYRETIESIKYDSLW